MSSCSTFDAANFVGSWGIVSTWRKTGNVKCSAVVLTALSSSTNAGSSGMIIRSGRLRAASCGHNSNSIEELRMSLGFDSRIPPPLYGGSSFCRHGQRDSFCRRRNRGSVARGAVKNIGQLGFPRRVRFFLTGAKGWWDPSRPKRRTLT